MMTIGNTVSQTRRLAAYFEGRGCGKLAEEFTRLANEIEAERKGRCFLCKRELESHEQYTLDSSCTFLFCEPCFKIAKIFGFDNMKSLAAIKKIEKLKQHGRIFSFCFHEEHGWNYILEKSK
ncbi:MAG: hypothetical protein Q6361_03875, partial [Candidatus Hermodarchaeota archaeon]|nr:hypothetical protein [Candidatus Hermodarchaeota archaeon]